MNGRGGKRRDDIIEDKVESTEEGAVRPTLRWLRGMLGKGTSVLLPLPRATRERLIYIYMATRATKMAKLV